MAFARNQPDLRPSVEINDMIVRERHTHTICCTGEDLLEHVAISYFDGRCDGHVMLNTRSADCFLTCIFKQDHLVNLTRNFN